MPFFMFDFHYLLYLAPAILLAMWAQIRRAFDVCAGPATAGTA